MSQSPLGDPARYQAVAGVYERLLQIASLGHIRRLYRALAEALEPTPGGTLVELGCGPASVTPYLLPRVEPGGHLIGVDLAEAMVERARRRAETRGWRHVRFEQGDALRWAPPAPVDVVVFSLSLSGLPEWERCIERALAMLLPGGQLAVLDSFSDVAGAWARWLIRRKAAVVGARPEGIGLAPFRALDALRVRSLSGGVYAVVAGRKPGVAPPVPGPTPAVGA